MEHWTMKRYRQYCRGTAADMKSEHKDQLRDASLWFDVAQGVLSTEPELKAWLLAKRFYGVRPENLYAALKAWLLAKRFYGVRPENLYAALADDLASGGKF